MREQVQHLIVKSDSGVTSLEENAFSYAVSGSVFDPPENEANTVLKSVDLDGIDGMGQAFRFCTNLTDIEVSNASEISAYAFSFCEGLTTVNLFNVPRIDNFAFQGCTKLPSFTLDGVSSIGDGAFMGCSNLKTVTLTSSADGLTLEGSLWYNFFPFGAFTNCPSLQTVTLNRTLNEVQNYAFSNIDETSAITPNSAVTIKCTGGLEAFVKACPGDEKITDITDENSNEIKKILNKVGIDNANQIQSLS